MQLILPVVYGIISCPAEKSAMRGVAYTCDAAAKLADFILRTIRHIPSKTLQQSLCVGKKGSILARQF